MDTSKTLAYTVRPVKGDAWRQLALVVDQGIYWLELTPTMLGYNVTRHWTHGPAEWPNMTAERIVAWRLRSGAMFEPSTESDARFAREWWENNA